MEPKKSAIIEIMDVLKQCGYGIMKSVKILMKYGKRKKLIGYVKDALIVHTSKGEFKEHFYWL